MKQPLVFSKKILFIEFFIREFRFYGKGSVRAELPPDAFFYTGSSKATAFRGDACSPNIGFESDVPFVSDSIREDLLTKIFKDNTNIVCAVSEEYVDKDNRWWKGQYKLTSNKIGEQGNQGQLPYANFKSIAPYGFNIIDINEDGRVETNFPNQNITLSIEKGQTLCFLCRREERGDGEWYTPNLNLVLFVKNHGLHGTITFRSQVDIDRIVDNNKLCNDKFSLRDFRKSALNFELG